MSHIFDALQRSEADRSGVKKTASATATELLERAERQARSQWNAELTSAEAGEHELTEAELGFVTDAIQPDSVANQVSRMRDACRGAEPERVFDMFEAVSAPVSAKNRLVCLTDKGSPAAEAFRLLKVRLRHLRKDKALKKLLITSTVPEEGKSFAAGNLACALASGSQEKVLLVGGDLRRPSLSSEFGVTARPGMCEYLQGRCPLTSSIYYIEGAGIWLFPAGSAEGDPLEIIQSTKLPALMAQLAEWFDWILIDSPPILPLADTTALARLADGILLVTRRDITEKRKLKKGLEAFESNKLIGALLNSSSSAKEKDYYYYRHQLAPSEQ
jgi:capsular exopolysaccharide synthesis family protein